MFEDAILRPAPVRGWAVTLGFAGQLAVIGSVLVAPLIWPQLLPRAETITSIFAPGPPMAEVRETPVTHVRPTKPWVREGATFYRPVQVPSTTVTLDAPPEQGPTVIGAGDNVDPGKFTSVFDAFLAPAGAKRIPEATAVPVAPAPAAVQQIRMSGPIQEGRLVHRVDPMYPPIAQKMRISGTVELNGVIGTDGRIRELRVAHGHPLLVAAALDAVRQWVYKPTLLGGNPVEVITTITAVFRLN